MLVDVAQEPLMLVSRSEWPAESCFRVSGRSHNLCNKRLPASYGIQLAVFAYEAVVIPADYRFIVPPARACIFSGHCTARPILQNRHGLFLTGCL